jgi:hypothetical protein
MYLEGYPEILIHTRVLSKYFPIHHSQSYAVGKVLVSKPRIKFQTVTSECKTVTFGLPKLSQTKEYQKKYIISVLEKLMVTRLVKKFPTFHRTQRFIIILTKACQMTPS